MACPFFLPTTLANRLQGIRAPLGGIFDGECRAHAEPSVPQPDVLYGPCNFGYPKGGCPCFPSEAAADAVRFTFRSGQLHYVYEREHVPAEHGAVNENTERLLAEQARVFSLMAKRWQASR